MICKRNLKTPTPQSPIPKLHLNAPSLEGYLDWVNKGHKSKRDIESLADHDWLMFLNVEKALQRLEYSYLKGQYESYKEDGVSFDVVYNSLKKLSKLR